VFGLTFCVEKRRNCIEKEKNFVLKSGFCLVNFMWIVTKWNLLEFTVKDTILCSLVRDLCLIVAIVDFIRSACTIADNLNHAVVF